MKTLMLGNEAAARGLFEAGCSFVSSYPGTPSTEITECAAKYRLKFTQNGRPTRRSPWKRPSARVWPATRSFCGMKHVGLNVAADPLFTAVLYRRAAAVLVIGVADDAGMHSSQNEQDSRHYAIAAKLPMLEPSDAAECAGVREARLRAFRAVRYPRASQACAPAWRIPRASLRPPTGRRARPSPYEKNIAKFVMMPACAKAPAPHRRAAHARAAGAGQRRRMSNRVEDGSDHSIGHYLHPRRATSTSRRSAAADATF